MDVTDFNQPPPRRGYDAWGGDDVLRTAVMRCGAGWIAPRAELLGRRVGGEELFALADQANRHPPQLRSHDPRGERIDEVEFHPAYHALMREAFGAGLHSLAWTEQRDGRHAARAALNYLWNQAEQGTACPVTMSFAARVLLPGEDRPPMLEAEWLPRLLANDHDPRPLPVEQKRAVTLGMAMTERQGGSDLRDTRTTAQDAGDGSHRLRGAKWFCSVPMSDAFFTLAKEDGALGCFFVPRWLPEGRNAIRIDRLKDKCGNRSNATAEIAFEDARAFRVGAPGRGIATLLAMAQLTRFDIVVASAGMMRAMAMEAAHHCAHRRAFGRRLAEQPLMANVLAELALEWQAAALLAFRTAQTLDRGGHSPSERALARLLVPIGKYWLCRRVPAVALEAMECLGGNGYIEESPLARFWREAPVNGIWEGSGNVICLDVLRVIGREPEAVEALAEEIAAGDAALAGSLDELRGSIVSGANAEADARRLVEKLALSVQASLMARHASDEAAGAFIASRVGGEGGRQIGTLPARFDAARIAAILHD